METLKKIVSNQYFPAGAVLGAVLLFWAVGLLGGLSLLHNNQPPLTTLTWMLFVYLSAVLTPIAGLLAALDLARRWRRNRAAVAASPTSELQPAGQSPEQPAPQPQAPQQPAMQPQAPQPQARTAREAHRRDEPKKDSKQPGRKQAA